MGSAARCRSTRATSSPSPPRSSPASRSSGSRTARRTCRPTRSPATTTSTPRWAPTKDGKITGLKVKTIADHGYTDAAADPSKFPAGLFNVITGSYDFAERVRRGRRRLHEQAARRRRLPLLVPGDRGRPRHRADGRHPRPRDRQGPGPAPDGELHPAGAVPVQDADRLGVRLGRLPGRAPEGDGHDRLRRAAQGAGREARARRAHGHRHQQLHRDRRRRAVARLRHPRA